MTPTNSAEKVVAEWRDAMEGVPDGEIERAFIVDGYGEAIQGEAVLYLPDDNEAEFRGAHAEVISAWFERCSPSGISGLLDRLTAAEARVTALERDLTSVKQQCETAVYNISQREHDEAVVRSFQNIADFSAQALSRSSTEVKNDE
jgi:hypothetical protein